MNQFVKWRAIRPPSAALHQHRRAVVRGDKKTGDMRVLSPDEHVEVRLSLSVATEDEDPCCDRRGGESRRDLRQCPGQRFQPRSEVPRFALSGAAVDDKD